MSFNYDDIIDGKSCEAVRAYTEGGGKTACVKTFGCQQNEADSEKILGILTSLGFGITESFEGASLIILNTCAVRAHAEEKVLSLLGGIKALKRKNPELIVGVVGCMGAVMKTVETLKRDFHYVSFTMGAGAMHKLPELLADIIAFGGRRFLLPEEREKTVEGMPTKRAAQRTAFVSIMYGCNNFCSYCIVPYTRGRERSRESKYIIEECRELISGGAREIMLLGQNVNSYSSDLDFPALLEKIAGLEGDFSLRFMTSHPKDVSERLIAVMSEHSDKIAPIFHLPLQSGSDRILRDMNRRYDRERFIATARKIKQNISGVSLTTDVIVGYPGESEEDFLDTLSVLCEVRFDAVYAFLYSARAGTPAAKRTDALPEGVKRERLSRLLQLQDKIALEINSELVGRAVTVFCEEQNADFGGRYRGRTRSGKLVHFSSECAPQCDKIKVKITSAEPYFLIGEAEK